MVRHGDLRLVFPQSMIGITSSKTGSWCAGLLMKPAVIILRRYDDDLGKTTQVLLWVTPPIRSGYAARMTSIGRKADPRLCAENGNRMSLNGKFRSRHSTPGDGAVANV